MTEGGEKKTLLEYRVEELEKEQKKTDKFLHGETGNREDTGLNGRVTSLEGERTLNKVLFALFGGLGTLAIQKVASLFEGALGGTTPPH